MTDPLDHIALAISRLPHMYRGGNSNTEKAIRALLSPAPQLAQAMWDALYQRSVDTAVGVQLDAIGALVGRPRNGIADDEIYRRYCRAQIRANKSDGVIEDILAVARLVLNDDTAALVIRNHGNGASTLEVRAVLSEAVAAVLLDLLIKATSGGVRRILEYSPAAPSTVGRWTTQGTWGSAVWGRAIDSTFSTGSPTTAAIMSRACRGGIWTAGYLCQDAGGGLAAAFGGANLSEVASGGSPAYGVPGPFGDRAVRISVANTGFQAPNSTFLDIGTGDTCGAVVLRITAAQSLATYVCSKTNFSGGPGFTIQISADGHLTFEAIDSVGSHNAITAAGAVMVGDWTAIMWALDKSTNRMRIGAQSLSSGVQVVGAELNIAGLGAMSNSDLFRVNRAGSLGAPLEIEDVYIGVGAGAAAGLAAGLPTALASFVAYLGKPL